MTLSELCIRRPVMTGLLSVAAVLVGLLAYFKLPVAALPRVEFPIIVVSASLPGASPEIMASSVAAPLEREFTTIAGIDTISSTSQLGSTSITLEFALDRDIDAAAQDVQAALARAARRLPEEMTTPPSFRKVNPADAPVLMLALSSPTIPLWQLDDYAETIISPRISRLTGVAQVLIWGAQKFAVRIQIDPQALAAKGIGVDQVESALVSANANSPVGTLSGPRREITLLANDQLRDAAAFRDIIIADRGNAPVRLRDVARVVDSVENVKTASWFDGHRAIVLAVQRQPDANTVQVVDRVRALLPTLSADLPPSVSVAVLNDRALSIRHAVSDVQLSLVLTVGLVVLVIFLFLRRLTVTVIPALAIPISLIVTCAGMWWLGFSLDNISLLGLTLCVGLVVDDAIVMLENIHRHVEQGMTPFAAALKGSREIGFTIISITASLIAVFIPLFAMGGVVGRMFFEFAMVVTMAIVVSALMSLTLTPMMASRIGASHHGGGGRFERIAEAAFDGMLAFYGRTLGWVLRHRRLTLLVLLGTVAASVWLFVTIPKGFFPIEDIGQISVTTEAGQGTSFATMAELQQQAAAIVQADPAVATLASAVGSGGNTVNVGRMFVNLVPREQRPPVGEVIQRLRRAVSKLPGMNVFMQPVQNLRIGGRSSKALYQYTMQGIETAELYPAADRMMAAMSASPLLQDVTSDLQLSAPQARLDIDRAKAAELGVPIDQIRSTLYSAFGSRQVSTIYTPTNDYQVILEVDPALQGSIEDLRRLYVSSTSGGLVPVEAFASIEQLAGPLSVNHLSQLPAVTLSFNLAPGHSLGEAVDAIHALEVRQNLPATISTSFAGTAKVFQEAGANQLLMLLAAVLVIYTVLGVLYESLIHPLTILSGLPSAALGALITLRLFGLELTVVAIIGVLMLIGIVKKNAIMMIDFALDAQRTQGLPAEQAITQACLLRFRPIMMTTMAALFGTLPIALGAGASAELRQPLGLAVVGGLIVSQALTLYITPVIYLYLDRLAGRRGAGSAEVVPAAPSRRPHRAA